MRKFRLSPIFLTCALLLAGVLNTSARAQVPPSPTVILTQGYGTSSLTAPGNIVYVLNGAETIHLNLTTASAVTATLQATSDRGSSPVWTTIAVVSQVQGNRPSINSTGFYRANVSGWAQVRLNVSAVTGTLNVVASAGLGQASGVIAKLVRQTYSAVVIGLTPAASATDLITITGSASRTVEVQNVTCTGVSTAAATGTLVGLLRSTANTGGTSSAVTATPLISTAPTATATVLSYTANPTTGTLVGNVRANYISTTTATSTAVAATPMVWDFNQASPVMPPTLIGAANVFAINGNGATFASGTAFTCTVTWTEF